MTFLAEVDNVTKDEWHRILLRFEDAVIHQSWSFGASVWGENALSHLVLRQDGVIVAAAQVVIARLPVLRAGIAHIKFGPLWRLRGERENPEHLREILRALRQEYSVRRGLVLRIKFWEVVGAEFAHIREAEGFYLQQDLPHYRTLVIDLSHSLDELYRGLRPKWRYNFKRASAKRHCVTVEDSRQSVEAFANLFREMQRRKGFYDTSEVLRLPEYVFDLPQSLRPRLLCTREDGKLVAAVVVSLIGNRGFYLYGATAEAGLRSGASYAIHWEALRWLKEQDCRWYDLVGAYPPLSRSGVLRAHQFKAGLAGKYGVRVDMGDYDACESLSSAIAVGLAFRLRTTYRNTRHRLKGWTRAAN